MSEANIQANVNRLQQVLLGETRPQLTNRGAWGMAHFQLLAKQEDLEDVVQALTRIASDSAFPDCTFTVEATLLYMDPPKGEAHIHPLSAQSGVRVPRAHFTPRGPG